MRRVIIVTAIAFSFNARRPDAQTRFLEPQQVNRLPSLPPDHRISYGQDVEQFGELRLPRGVSGRVPVAVVLHGGCWKARHGDLVADVQNTAPLASALTKLGIATWKFESAGSINLVVAGPARSRMWRAALITFERLPRPIRWI